MARIRGKTVLVTGATAGIGRAVAHVLAGDGASVIATGRRTDRLDELADEIRGAGGEIRAEALDVRDRTRVNALAERLAEEGVFVEILVNNAGLARGLNALQDGSHEDWDEMIDTNITGVLNATRAFLPEMVRRDRGHVVHIGSIAGHLVYPKGNVYNATKFAVRALTEGGNLDLAGTKVRMSSVDPGMVKTDFSLVRFRGDEPRAKEVYRGLDALLPEDVADAVRYVVNAPSRVNVLRMIVMPRDQRSPYVFARRGEQG